MCIYAQNASQMIHQGIGSNGRHINVTETICQLKEKSPEMMAMICMEHMNKGIGGSMLSYTCPVYSTGNFAACPYSR